MKTANFLVLWSNCESLWGEGTEKRLGQFYFQSAGKVIIMTTEDIQRLYDTCRNDSGPKKPVSKTLLDGSDKN